MRWQQSLSANKPVLFLVILGIVALLWANLPYLVGYAIQDELRIFGGFFIFEQDGYSYLAKMRQGAEGSWLFTLPYTAEPQKGAFVYAFYLVVGKLARLIRIPDIGMYHVARLGGSVLLLATSAQFVARFASTPRWRRLTWSLLLFGGGIGWLLSTLNPHYVAYASITPDAFLYSVLFGPPHIIFALFLLIWLLNSVTGQLPLQAGSITWSRWLLMSLAGLLMALARPEYMGILPSTLGAYCLALAWRRRRMPAREAMLFGILISPGMLYALYVFYLSQTDPAMTAWAAQNPFSTPPVTDLLAGLGLFLLAGALGMTTGKWWNDETRLLLMAWIAVLPILLYLPLSLNRRLIGGAQFALAVAAGYWLDQHLFPWLKRTRRRHAIAVPVLIGIALLLFSYPIFFGVGGIAFVASRPDKLFIAAEEMAAMDWLSDKDDRPIVFSAEETGNHLPAFSSAIPVLGHPVETLSITKKRLDVACFYSADTLAADRQAILAKYSPDLIWWGPNEKNLGAFSPAGLPGAQLAFQEGNIQVWRSPP